MLLFSEIQVAAEIAVFAAVFSDILTAPRMIFAKYGEWLDTLPDWIAKPLGSCSACLAGQIGFWAFIISEFEMCADFPVRLFAFCSAAILFAFLLSALIRAARRQ